MQSKSIESDEELFFLVKKGNHLAFQMIYNKYWYQLYANVYNVLSDKGLTEDVLHEVFTDIWIRKDDLEIRNLKSYLYKAVRNHALLKIRNERLESFSQKLIDHLTSEPEIELVLDQKDLKETIEKAIEQLPTRCKDIFYMSRYDDYSILEIAKHFNISKRTVENQIHRALKHIRSVLTFLVFLLFLR